jgi:hypothetical protein
VGFKQFASNICVQQCDHRRDALQWLHPSNDTAFTLLLETHPFALFVLNLFSSATIKEFVNPSAIIFDPHNL